MPLIMETKVVPAYLGLRFQVLTLKTAQKGIFGPYGRPQPNFRLQNTPYLGQSDDFSAFGGCAKFGNFQNFD